MKTKQEFAQWLSDNYTIANALGIDCILSRLDKNLNIINANEGETEILQDWLRNFREQYY